MVRVFFTTATIVLLALTASARSQDTNKDELVGAGGCRYQAERLLLSSEIEREGLAQPLRKFEERLKRGEETFVPQKDQTVELYVVNCKAPDYPALWARVDAAPILLIPRGWLQQAMYK